jgi:predicted methyltransferase
MKLYSLLILIVLSSCSHKYPERTAELPKTLDEAVNFSFRNPENTQRDKYQHPKETLEFFGLKPTMTVVEISPGAGYYTEILAPLMVEKGKLYLAIPRMPPNAPPVMYENEKKLQDILLRHQAVQTKTKIIPFEPLGKRSIVQKSSVDMVVTFNSVHNWVATQTVPESFQLFYDVLKPGGVLGIVQHRIREGKKKVPKSGYMFESEVIKMARRYGFKIIKKSAINANSKDKADYPEGVWTLPPTYRLGDEDRNKYEDIGESDRMTLKFIKQ